MYLLSILYQFSLKRLSGPGSTEGGIENLRQQFSNGPVQRVSENDAPRHRAI